MHLLVNLIYKHLRVKKIKKIADYICSAEGGKGVLREISELILTYNKN